MSVRTEWAVRIILGPGTEDAVYVDYTIDAPSPGVAVDLAKYQYEADGRLCPRSALFAVEPTE